MLKYIIKRILLLIPILLGVSAIIFILKTVTPGDPARQILGNSATEEQVQEKREELGLNDPVIVQYVRYIKNIVTKGDFGDSYRTGEPVLSEILPRLRTSGIITIGAVAIGAIIGIILGIISALKKYTWVDSLVLVISMFFQSVPEFVVALVLIMINFVIRPIQVRGSSMYPTLQNGSLGVSNLLGYNLDGIKRFDIVIVYLEDKKEYLVKRVVGLPNETVAYIGGKLYINGEMMEEDFLDQNYRDSYEGSFMEDVAPVTLGSDEYFCLGDNRPHSTDSRYYGPFAGDKILSKGVFIFYPFSAVGVETW